MACCTSSSKILATEGPNYQEKIVDDPMAQVTLLSHDDNSNMVESAVEDGVKFVEAANETWGKINDMASTVQSLNLDKVMPSLKQVGQVAQVILPSLVAISSSVPFAGPVTVVMYQFYESVSLALNNKEKLAQLVDRVDETATWMNSSLKPLKKIKDQAKGPEYEVHMNMIEKCIVNLVYHINRCNEVLKKFLLLNHANSCVALINLGKRAFFSESDQKEIASIGEDIERAQNKLNQNFSVLTLEWISHVNTKIRQSSTVSALQELFDSPFINFDSEINEHLSRFQAGSREWMHSMVRLWSVTNEERMFWICAEAGMGKSAFTASVVTAFKAQHKLLGVFFCRYGEKSRSDGINIIKSLAYQLAENFEDCRESILKQSAALSNKLSLVELMKSLIIKPLENLRYESNYFIVIDALDEVGIPNSVERVQFLDLICNCVSLLPRNVKMLVTSRPDSDILQKFSRFKRTTIDANDPRHIVDLRKFISFSLRNQLVDIRELPAATDLLLEKSEGRFIYVAMAVQENFNNSKKWTLQDIKRGLPNGLDSVYLNNFKRIRDKDPVICDTKLRPLLALLVTMKEPLLCSDVEALLDLSSEDLEELAHLISSMFPIKGIDDKRFHVFHKSVIDWLLDPKKSQMHRYLTIHDTISLWLQEVLPKESLTEIASLCDVLINAGIKTASDFFEFDLQVWNEIPIAPVLKGKMRRHLDKIINGTIPYQFQEEDGYDFYVDANVGHQLFLHGYRGYLTKFNVSLDISIPMEINSTKLPQSAYFYSHFIDHLISCNQAQVAETLLMNLSWLMDCMRELQNGIRDIVNNFKSLVSYYHIQMNRRPSEEIKILLKVLKLSRGTLELSKKRNTYDDSEFVYALIARLDHESVLQMFPTDSAIRNLLDDCKTWKNSTFNNSYWIPLIYNQPDPLGELETSISFDSAPECITPLPNNRVLVAFNQLMEIWDPDNSDCIMTINGLSFDGKSRRQSKISSLELISEHTMVAAVGYYDGRIQIWDLRHGELIQEWYGHTTVVVSLCVYPPDKNLLVSTGGDCKTVKVWDLTTYQCYRSYKFKTRRKQTGCCSFARRVFTTVTDDGRIVAADDSGYLQVFYVHYKIFKSINVFRKVDKKVVRYMDIAGLISLNDGKVLRVGSDSLSVWDINTREYVRTIKHINYNHRETSRYFRLGVFLLPNNQLLVGEHRGSIALWDIGKDEVIRELRGHSDYISDVSMLSNGKFVSISKDVTLKVWDLKQKAAKRIEKPTKQRRGNQRNDWSEFDEDEYDDGRTKKPPQEDRPNSVEKVDDDAAISGLYVHDNAVNGLRFIGDHQVISSSQGVTNNVALWDIKNQEGKFNSYLKNHTGDVTSLIVYSPTIAITSSIDNTVIVWDVPTKTPLKTLSHDSRVYKIHLFEGNRLVSACHDYVLKIWSMDDYECVYESKSIFDDEYSAYDRMKFGREPKQFFTPVANNLFVDQSPKTHEIVVFDVNQLAVRNRIACPKACSHINMHSNKDLIVCGLKVVKIFHIYNINTGDLIQKVRTRYHFDELYLKDNLLLMRCSNFGTSDDREDEDEGVVEINQDAEQLGDSNVLEVWNTDSNASTSIAWDISWPLKLYGGDVLPHIGQLNVSGISEILVEEGKPIVVGTKEGSIYAFSRRNT